MRRRPQGGGGGGTLGFLGPLFGFFRGPMFSLVNRKSGSHLAGVPAMAKNVVRLASRLVKAMNKIDRT